ncbi:thiol-disulfide oxidoreductase DCC family protein [Ulvibacter litoralis]|uniref:thiol-disulfide oxidoreductase DCC family protein n=1 Tax=Ulvibacter litoralis TaxID=227084 RepID=UPI000B8707D5
MTSTHKIILFDGVCNLCNSSVQLVLKNDAKDTFRLAALQSDAGQQLIQKFGIDTSETDSIILIVGETYYSKSTAALKIAKHLSGAFPLLYAFMIVPKFIRNIVYDYIAKNRYKWYGKQESCMIPTTELKSKFL